MSTEMSFYQRANGLDSERNSWAHQIAKAVRDGKPVYPDWIEEYTKACEAYSAHINGHATTPR